MKIRWIAPLGAVALACALGACGSSTGIGGGEVASGAGGNGETPPPPPLVEAGKTCSNAAAEATEAHIRGLADGTIGQYIVSFYPDAPVKLGAPGGVSASQRHALEQLGVRGIYFKRLPIVGVVATRAQALQLAALPGVRSVRLNERLSYEDEQARVITSATQAAAAPELVNAAGEPITGKGVTILVNDSGIDATHPDLLFGSKTVVNTLGHTNLSGVAENDMLPSEPIENVPNTDVAGSHGTHVAGIAAGDGSASSGQFLGSAPGATLAGYGSGAVLFVLDTIGGFDYALRLLDERPELNLRIITNSFGNTGDVGTCFDPDDPTNIASKALADRNVIVVFSAGNSGSGPDTITGNFKKAPWVMVAANAEKTGLLASSSSRGSLANQTYEAEMDGETFVIEDRPTVTTPGTDIVSTRAIAVDPLTPLSLPDEIGHGYIPPQMLPFYTEKTGTSMAAPHLAGLIALLLEANPALTWREIKPLLKRTASNMPGYAPWEVGAGMANIEAAIADTLALRRDYGRTNHTQRGFHASISLGEAQVTQEQIDYVPAGETGSVSFEVGDDISLIIAQWSQPTGDPCTCAVVLIDPNGNRYGSSIAVPVIGANVAASAPGMPGTWTLTVRGIGSISGVSADPLGITNGVAGPSTLDITLQQFMAGTPVGLRDIEGHPAQSAIEFAVSKRLVDGLAGGFAPDTGLTREQMAEYLMAWGVRQTRSHDGSQLYSDTRGVFAAAADAVTRPGSLLMDLSMTASPLMSASGSQFNPGGSVTVEQMAYALVQAIGRESGVATHEGKEMHAIDADGVQVPVADADDVSPALRNHVQDALVLNILDVEFFEDGGERRARIHPQRAVTRAAYARAAGQTYRAVPFPD
ncbi:MAG TPA: S8 family serine peptidase [Fontimonas sp.]